MKLVKKEVILALSLILVAFVILYVYSSNGKVKQAETASISINQECVSSLSFSLSGNGTCDLTMTALNINCKNKNYEIRNDYSNCSGTLNSNEELVLCNWQIPNGSYTYSLYVDEQLKDSKAIMCQEFPATPSICTA